MMKHFLLILGLALTTAVSATTYTQNFEGGSRGTLINDSCYGFSDIAYNRGRTAPISGDYSAVTGPLSNMSQNATITTPYLYFNGNRNLTFDHRVTNTGGGNQYLDVMLIDSFDNIVATVFSHTYNTTALVSENITITEDGVYKLRWRWYGSGGRGRGVIDNIVSTATFACDYDNCAPDLSLTPLPVTLISFNALRTNNTEVKISWATAMELNNDYFELRKSVQGGEFETIAIINGMGTSNEVNEYSFIDYETASDVVYKLMQFDFDGTKTVFNPVWVGNVVERETKIYPNPTQSHTTIQFGKDAESMQIKDLQGNIVYHAMLSGNTIRHLNASSFRVGIYIVTVNYPASTSTNRLVISR
jgi:hypothetical protein